MCGLAAADTTTAVGVVSLVGHRSTRMVGTAHWLRETRLTQPCQPGDGWAQGLGTLFKTLCNIWQQSSWRSSETCSLANVGCVAQQKRPDTTQPASLLPAIPPLPHAVPSPAATTPPLPHPCCTAPHGRPSGGALTQLLYSPNWRVRTTGEYGPTTPPFPAQLLLSTTTPCGAAPLPAHGSANQCTCIICVLNCRTAPPRATPLSPTSAHASHLGVLNCCTAPPRGRGQSEPCPLKVYSTVMS